MPKEDLNIGLILQYNTDHAQKIDTDNLVRFARNNGFRGVSITDNDDSQIKSLQDACEKYSIAFCEKHPAIKLEGPDILARLIAARLEKQNIYLEVDLNEAGDVDQDKYPDLEIIQNWIGRFGHAYFEARPDKEIKINTEAHAFKNAIAPYQIYVFIHQPLPGKVELDHVPEIKEAMWIDTRKDLEFEQDGDHLTITLQRDEDDDNFTIYGLRLQAYRPEDTMGPTKY